MMYHEFEEYVKIRNNDECNFTFDEYTEIIEPVYTWISCFTKQDIADLVTSLSKEKVLKIFSAMLLQVEIEKKKDDCRKILRYEISKKLEELEELETRYKNI